LAAYLIGHIDTGAAPGGAVFTAAQADAAAVLMVAAAQAGTILTLAVVNGILAGVVAATTLTAGGSTGVLTELLSVMAGNQWLIPSGTAISDGGGAFAGTVGAFVVGTYTALYDTGEFYISNAEGNISRYKRTTFLYDGVQGAALTVYAADGTLL